MPGSKPYRLHVALLVGVMSASLVACGGSDSKPTPDGGGAGGNTTDGGGGAGGGGGSGGGGGGGGSTVDGGGSDAPASGDGPAATDGPGGDVMALDPDAQAALMNCMGKADGTDCGGGSICVKNVCVSSRCGDGYVHAATNEECEDGNDMAGDGCFNCRFECRADTDCDDKNACNGAETCDKSMAGKQLCKAGTAPMAGSACMIEGGAAGVCRDGTCAQAGCGNSTVEAGEECDDGNADDADGCTRQCKFTCKVDMDCDDGNKCNGTETCDVATHKCKVGTAVICMGMGCTGTCEPSTGMCSYPDVDKDGKACDTDCNDADPAIFPGGFECKDGKDNDCNAMTADSTAPGCECYVDTDKDDYAVNTTGAIASGGTCPDGFTRRRPENMTSIDCGARTPEANPGQRSYFPTAYCPSGVFFRNPTTGVVSCLGGTSFDYNCDKQETPFDNTTAAATCVGATNALFCIIRSGWVGAIPACGAKGTYRQCTWTNNACSGSDIPNRVQECR